MTQQEEVEAIDKWLAKLKEIDDSMHEVFKSLLENEAFEPATRLCDAGRAIEQVRIVLMNEKRKLKVWP